MLSFHAYCAYHPDWGLDPDRGCYEHKDSVEWHLGSKLMEDGWRARFVEIVTVNEEDT